MPFLAETDQEEIKKKLAEMKGNEFIAKCKISNP